MTVLKQLTQAQTTATWTRRGVESDARAQAILDPRDDFYAPDDGPQDGEQVPPTGLWARVRILGLIVSVVVPEQVAQDLFAEGKPIPVELSLPELEAIGINVNQVRVRVRGAHAYGWLKAPETHPRMCTFHLAWGLSGWLLHEQA